MQDEIQFLVAVPFSNSSDRETCIKGFMEAYTYVHHLASVYLSCFSIVAVGYAGSCRSS